jgi:DNA-binding GntR family transcriptional regulator
VIIQESLVDMATEEIRKLIVAGKLEPGERIYEPRLAEMLGISRPPLREALRILAAQHILEQTPRRGYHVVELTSRDVDEIYSLRRSLEDFGLELAIPQLPYKSLGEVEAAMSEMWAAAKAGDEAGVVLANRTFHEAAIDLADHHRLSQTYRSLMDQMQLCMSKNLRTEASQSGDLAEGCERHERLLESLRSGDRERIYAAMKSHGERNYLPAAPSAPAAAVPEK